MTDHLELLRRFRDHVASTATQWRHGGGSAPIWQEVIAALAPPAPAGGEAPDGRKKLQDEIERIIISRLYNKRIDGYTIEMATQIVDTIYARADAITPPPSPDVAGVVEMLREGARSIDDDGTASQVGPSSDQLCEAATLLESLSAEKGVIIEECAKVADAYAEEVGRARYAAFEIAERIRARVLTPKDGER